MGLTKTWSSLYSAKIRGNCSGIKQGSEAIGIYLLKNTLHYLMRPLLYDDELMSEYIA
jgi:hypothetical protein